MLAKVISISNLYISISENVEINNRTGIHYDVARLVRTLVIFEPIEPIDEDLNRDLLPDVDFGDPDLNIFHEDDSDFTH